MEVDQGIVFPLLTSGTSDGEVGEVSREYCLSVLPDSLVFGVE